MSQVSLARLVSEHVQAGIHEDAIGKIEKGQPVEGHVLSPVLTVLGLHPPPSQRGPATAQPAGDWLRDLRESKGIAPKQFCWHARYATTTARRLSRTTLAAVEAGQRQPSWRMLDALSAGFTGNGVTVSIEDLEVAWGLFIDWDAEAVSLLRDAQPDTIKATRTAERLAKTGIAAAALGATRAIARTDALRQRKVYALGDSPRATPRAAIALGTITAIAAGAKRGHRRRQTEREYLNARAKDYLSRRQAEQAHRGRP